MRFVITLDISDEDITEGWKGDPTEVAISLAVRLDEVIGDDGGAYVPEITDITAHTDADLPVELNAQRIHDYFMER